MRERGFGEEVWTWNPKHQTAGFWLRRMVHDLVVHRFDAEAAASTQNTAPAGADSALARDLAADGVADLLLCLEMFQGLAGAGETLQFRATDIPRSWHVTLTSSGIAWTDGDRPADVTVAAPVLTLLLVLNRRLPAPATVEGDAGLWERWRAGSRF